MKTMYTLFCEQKNTYYGQELCAETLFSGVHCSQSCEALIHSYFTWGHKHELFHLNFIDQYIARGKHTHTVSLYLLGIALAGLFQDPVYRHLQSFLPELDGWYDKDRDASYTWFLTCLYHDVASCIEQTKIPEDPTERQKTLDYYLGDLNIQYSPYQAFPYRVDHIPFRFSEQLVKNYFFYRACSGYCEHGILAGYLFFDRYVKTFMRHVKGTLREGTEAVLDTDRNGQSLLWHKEHLSHAAYVADAIICHDLWMCGKEDEQTYRSYGLAPLIPGEQGKSELSIDDYPLQFMLCFLDTIEPIKRFEPEGADNNLSAKDVLEYVSVEPHNRGLKLDWKPAISQHADFARWFHALKGMETWMKISFNETTKEFSW